MPKSKTKKKSKTRKPANDVVLSLAFEIDLQRQFVNGATLLVSQVVKRQLNEDEVMPALRAAVTLLQVFEARLDLLRGVVVGRVDAAVLATEMNTPNLPRNPDDDPDVILGGWGSR